MRNRILMLLLFFAVAGLFGYWLAGTTKVPVAEESPDSEGSQALRRKSVVDEPAPRFRAGLRGPSSRRDGDALAAGAFEGQRVLSFKDPASLEAFLARAGDGIRLLGRLDSLNALRVGFSDYHELLALLDGNEEESFVFPVNAPAPEDGTVQPGAMALGNGLLDWLGVTGDNSDWGSGVRIAVLDTGVVSHSAFDTTIRSINLVDLPADSSLQNGHGTAVASVIVGNDSLTPGVAPGAEILSIRIAGEDGQSNSFLLAEGIVAAVDAGVRLINISMGSVGDSGLVRSAIEYARAGGVLIVAASGNNGLDQVSYPAANEGVVAVGAVDALGNHLDFSNYGESIAIAAPGLGVNAAWPGDQAASMTGTSFSSPIVAGAIAAIMTQSGPVKLTPTQAYQKLVASLNDGGDAGSDSQLGGGMPDIGRVLSAGTPGIYDAAVAGQRILPPTAAMPYGQVEVLVQNRGTEMLINTSVEVSTGAGVVKSNLTSLAPNAVATVRVPVSRPPTENSNQLRVDSKVRLSGGVRDAKPSNDRRVEDYGGAD